MSYITEKAAYLKGFAEGVKIDETTDQGKVMAKMIEVITEMAEYIDELEESIMENSQAIGDVEDFIDMVCDDLGDDCDCGCGHDHDDIDMVDYEDGDGGFYQLTCPHCHQDVFFDDDMLDKDELICPNCGKEIEVGYVDEEEGDED